MIQTETGDIRQAVLMIDGKALEEELVSISYTGELNGDDSRLRLGGAGSCWVKIKLKQTAQVWKDRRFSLKIADIPMGVFQVTEVTTTESETDLTAYDAMTYALERTVYQPGTAKTAFAVLDEIGAQAEVKLGDLAGFTDAAVVNLPEGYTCREMAGYMAALLGGNAHIDRNGKLAVRWYQAADFTVDPDRFYQGGLKAEDKDFVLEGVACTVTTQTTAAETDEEGNETQTQTTETAELTVGSDLAPLTLENPFMTQERLEAVYQTMEGWSYRPLSVTFFGEIRLEVGDQITVADTNGTVHRVPIMSVSHSWDGGLKTTVKAVGISQMESGESFSGSVTQQVQRLVADVAAFKNLSAQNLTATNARIKQLESDVINAGDLNAVNADIKNLQADVANIETVLAGNVGADNVQTVHLTSENVVIDDAIITDAMISDLTAGKITAGTLYTTLVKIASDEDENLLIDGSTIQIKDAAGTVRVQIGKDGNGDYNYYLWDADGKLMWSPTGVTADGLNNGIIKDINVADDAAIDGGKLDISSVAEKLNEDGSLTVTAGQVTIDNTTLDVSYKELTERVAETEETTHTLETDFTVIQGQVESKVWQSDIKEVTDPMGEKITTLEDRYSTINQTVNGISLAVGAVQTETAEAQSTADAASQSAADAQSTANSAQTTADANAESIKAVEAKLELKIDEDRLVSQLNASADEINITGDRLVIDSTYFKLAANGEVECTKGTFNGRVYSDSVIFSTGKQYLGDGLAGVGLSSGFVEICSDESPMIRFNRKNATDGTTYIVERADGVMTLSPNVEVTDGLTIGGFAVPKIQYGRESVTAGSDFDVTFPIAFPGYATITLTVNCNTYKIYYARIKTNSPTGFTARVDNLTNSDADTVTVHWMAMY